MNENAEAATGSASEVTTTTADIGGGTVADPSAEAREETAQAVDDPQAAEANPAANAPATETDRPEKDGKITEVEAAKPSEQPGEENLKSRVAELTAQLIAGKAEAAAAMLGVPEGKIKHVVKLSNLEGIDATKEDAAQKIREAVAQVLSDLPELAQTVTPNGTGSPGAFARKVSPEKSPFERGFEQG